MKKLLLILGITFSSTAWANSEICTLLRNNTNVFNAPIIKTCQRVPDGIIIQLSSRDEEEKKLALSMLAVSFGQEKHTLSDKKFSLYIQDNNQTKLKLPWSDAFALNNLFKKKKDIQVFTSDITNKFIVVTQEEKSEESIPSQMKNEVNVSNKTPILRGLPPPPPRL